MRRNRAVLAAILAAFVAVGPAQAVPDEGGGPARTAVVVASDGEGFDWGDAGVGAALGAAAVAALGVGVAVVRHQNRGRGLAEPATR
jgi:hypothetical protein